MQGITLRLAEHCLKKGEKMDRCPSHNDLINALNDIREDARGMRQDIKELRSYFDAKQEKTLNILTENRTEIAVLKLKQYLIAGLAGLGGSQLQDILKKIVF